MSDPFVAQIYLLACNFPPKGYAFCEGQLLPLSQNTALYSLITTTYGGDGTTNFALPDLRGRVPLGAGQGPGLTNYVRGQSGGQENVTLDVSQLPQHMHAINIGSLTAAARCRNAAGNQQTPVGNVPAIDAATGPPSYTNAAPDSDMHPAAVALGGGLTAAATGGNLPHINMQPSLSLHFCIALQGIFPPRD